MCCLTTAILQSYTVFADVQFKMFVQKKKMRDREEGGREGGKEKKRFITLSVRPDGTEGETGCH